MHFVEIDDVENVLLIVADSLRYDVAIRQMSTLQSLGEWYARYTSCFAVGPNTPSSMSGIMQSRLPIEGGYGTVLPESPPTLAEVLATSGVTCAGWHCNPHTIAERGFDRGFTLYSDLLKQPPLYYPDDETGTENSSIQTDVWRYRSKAIADKLGVRSVVDKVAEQLKQWGVVTVDPRIPAEKMVDAFETWLSETDHQTRFAYLHFMDTHMPYQPPDHHWDRSELPKVSSKRAQNLYRRMKEEDYDLSDDELDDLLLLYEAEAEYVDYELQRLVSLLQSRNMWDSSLLIFTSDHGELFGERTSPSGVYTGHPNYLCGELTHVPLIVAGGPVSSCSNDSLVSGVDLAPTIATAFGVQSPHEWRGESLQSEGHNHVISTVSGPPDKSGDQIDSEWLHLSVRTENRAVLWWRNDTPTEYYRRDDTRELEDSDKDQTEYESELEVARSYRDVTFTHEEISEDLTVDKQRLRDLGYMN